MKKYLKYIITVAVFVVVYVFVGDQSLVHRVGRWMQIRQLTKEKERYESEIQSAEQTLRSLEQTDSLERFARETYYMHTPEETVYVVED